VCGAYCKERCTKHASLITTTLNIIPESEPSGPSCVMSSLLQLCVSGVAVYQLVSWSQWLFWALLLILTLFTSWIEQLIFPPNFLAVVSYDVVLFNAWQLFNSQGKVVTQFRCNKHLLWWFGFALPWGHSMQKLQLYFYDNESYAWNAIGSIFLDNV